MLDKLYEKYDNVIYFDVETTGFDSKNDRIIELSFINTDKLNIKEKNFSTHDIYVKTKVPLEITELTGITQEKLDADGVAEIDLVDYFATFLHENTLLVAHNAQFDISFIRETFKRNGLEERIDKCDYLDSLTVLKDRKAYPHKLKDAIEYYGLNDVRNSHLAADDVLALFYLVLAMADQRDDIEKYINLFGFNGKYGVNGEMLDKVTYLEQKFNKGLVPQQYSLPSLAGVKNIPVEEKPIHIESDKLPRKETRVVLKGEVNNYEFLDKTMRRLFPSMKITIVTSDDKKGIDPLANKLADEWGIKKAIFNPNWKRYHRSAGHVRNASMIKYAAEANGYLITFGDSSLNKQAERKGLKVIEM